MAQELSLEALLQEYHHKKHEYGKYECILLVLLLTGFVTSTLEPYSTAREGRKVLSRATGQFTIKSYLISRGYSSISPVYLYDGDILLRGSHCFVYYDGMVFGVSTETNTFEFLEVSIENLNKFQVFRK